MGRRAGPQVHSRSGWVYAAAVILAIGGVVWLAGGGDEGSGSTAYTPVDGFADVHGLALDPQDPDTLYIATHHGLLRLQNDTGLARVGVLQHDYMGFTAHPTESGVFWVSGHPRGGGNMGVRKSTDGGSTWEQLALDGRADFHAMAISPADPDILWGFFAGQVQRSQDGGNTWEVLGSPPAGIFGFAPHPEDTQTVYAASQGGLLASRDGGRTWQVEQAEATIALAIHPADPSLWYRAAPSGVVKSQDAGQTWSASVAPGPGTVGYLALHPTEDGVLYAATFEAGLYKSGDDGQTWSTVQEPAR